ncbi:MAG TPA: dTDP-4-dehydrorhamnose reductase [Burkholderiaceae bacterium]|nr:dTDP-4-dehydrorhamnose reductase [Burkholderiaceae bacterium]
MAAATDIPTILLFGKSGQVGWELQRSLAPLGELIAVDFDSKDFCGDFANLAMLADTVRRVKPSIIVNAAAHTAVDKAESEPNLARTINALAPEVIAKEAQKLNAWMVHYSTDYVFDGSGENAWLETDQVSPLNVYGKTKWEGEQAITNNCNKHLIFRTSWVYAARGHNFAKTMLRLAKERDSLSVIDDQIGAPTGAELLADVTALALRQIQQTNGGDLAGLYHLVAGGHTSWHGFASFVINHAVKAGVSLQVQNNAIKKIATSEYTTPAKRPLNSRLNTDKVQTAFNITLPTWQTGVARMLAEIL